MHTAAPAAGGSSEPVATSRRLDVGHPRRTAHMRRVASRSPPRSSGWCRRGTDARGPIRHRPDSRGPEAGGATRRPSCQRRPPEPRGQLDQRHHHAVPAPLAHAAAGVVGSGRGGRRDQHAEGRRRPRDGHQPKSRGPAVGGENARAPMPSLRTSSANGSSGPGPWAVTTRSGSILATAYCVSVASRAVRF